MRNSFMFTENNILIVIFINITRMSNIGYLQPMSQNHTIRSKKFNGPLLGQAHKKHIVYATVVFDALRFKKIVSR